MRASALLAFCLLLGTAMPSLADPSRPVTTETAPTTTAEQLEFEPVVIEGRVLVPPMALVLGRPPSRRRRLVRLDRRLASRVRTSAPTAGGKP